VTNPLNRGPEIEPPMSRRYLGWPDPSTAPANVRAALDTIGTGREAVLALLKNFRDAMAAVGGQDVKDPRLSDAGRKDAQTIRGGEVRAQHGAQLDTLESTLEAAFNTIGAAATWPAAKPGVEALLTRQAMWSRTRPLLDAGIPADQLVSEANDAETLNMLRDELIPYLRTRGTREIDLDYISNVAVRRYAELSTPTLAGSFAALLIADIYDDALDVVIASARNEIATADRFGANFLSTSIQAENLTQDATRALLGGVDPGRMGLHRNPGR